MSKRCTVDKTHGTLYAQASYAQRKQVAFFDTQFALQESDAVRITASQRTSVEYQMCISIANEATWLYRNLKYPRYKNFYGYAQVMSGAFVVKVIPLTFLNQEILHWRTDSFGINDTTVCSVRILGAAMTPPVTGFGVIVKTRVRFTSVRFRLLPGVVANVSLVWEDGDSACGNLIEQPDERQGQPPLPNNSGPSGNPRPPNQTGDEIDPSDNDGNDNPNDGKPAPPSAGGGQGSGTWKVFVQLYDAQDQINQFTHNLGVTDRFAAVSVGTRPTGGPNSPFGKSDSVMTMTVNGQTSDRPITGFGMNVFAPFYQ